MQERFERLVALQERISLEKARAQVGTEVEVLVEGAGRRGTSSQARTRTNRIVHLEGAHARRGRSSTRASRDAAPHHLSGEVVPAPALV